MTDPDPERRRAIEEEANRARRGQRVADVTCALLAQSPGLTLGEALQMVAAARQEVLRLFPGSGPTFDLLYRPRFLRILSERFGLAEDEIHPAR
jgi:hypothetical protein